MEIVSAGNEGGANFIEWLDPNGDSAPVRVFAMEPVSITGATVASVMPWDAAGRSMLSFVELDQKGPSSRTLEVSSNPTTAGAFIHERLISLLAEAEELVASAIDLHETSRRLSAIDRELTRWAEDLPPVEVARYRERHRHARAALTTALAQAVSAKERLICEAEALAGSSEPVTALARFDELKRTWDNERLVERASEVKLRARFNAFEQFIVVAVRRAEASRDRGRDGHPPKPSREDKLQIIEELKALISSGADLSGGSRARVLYQQSNAADRLLRMIDTELAGRQVTHDDA